MLDLSFLTEAEQEAILKVLNRDAELKKAEQERILKLQDNVDDENELKYKSGQWFYEAKSKRHREKINGVDLVRASIRKRKKPAKTIELSGVMEPPDESEEDLAPSKAESNQSAKRVSFGSPEVDKEIVKNGTASPLKQRRNPFNSKDSVDDIDLDIEMPNPSPESDQVNGKEGKKGDLMSSISKYGVKLPYPSPIEDRQTSQQAEEDPSPKHPPVPKPRKLVINGQSPDQPISSLQREDSFNNGNKRKGILKRRSSSSSTDSESIRIPRIPQTVEPTKLVVPASPILEAEQTNFIDGQVTSSENSPDRQKQVRFSEKVQQKPPTPNPDSYNIREVGEFRILETGSSQNEPDYGFVDQPHYEEPKPTQFSYSPEVLGHRLLEENPSVQMPSSSSPILDVEKELEDPRQSINDNRAYEAVDEGYPDVGIDSAGPEPLYAEVKKSPKSTSLDQEKDLETENALTEPRLLAQRGKTGNSYQSDKLLEFGKSHGGAGKINYGSHYTYDQPESVYLSTNEDLTDPERAEDRQSSNQDTVDEPKTEDSDYYPKWRRPSSFEVEDLLAEQEQANVNFRDDADTLVKPYPENGTNSKYFPGEYKTDTKYKSIYFNNTPEAEGRLVAPSSNFPIAQNTTRPVSGDFQTQEAFLRDRDRRDLPKSSNFKVMSLKDRIHDMPREQMSNPSQFQSLRHFWNVEDKNQSKGDTSPDRILTDVSKRNKSTRANLKHRNSKEITSDEFSLPSSFDSLSEEEQTSQKVASWLAQTPEVYGAEQVDAKEEQAQPPEVIMENIDRKLPSEAFSSALQKPTPEAPKNVKMEHLKREDIEISPVKEPGLVDRKKSTTTILVNPAEKTPPATGFYARVVQISSTQSPAKESKVFVDPTSKQLPGEEVDESVERTVAPAKNANEFKIGFQKLIEEYESTKFDEPQVERPQLPSEKQQLIETNETVEKSSVPKGSDHQEFISALKKLETEASTPRTLEDQGKQLKTVSTLNTVSPVKSSSFKIGFEHLMPTEEDTIESPEKFSVTNTFQSLPPDSKDTSSVVEVVEKTTVPSRKEESDFKDALGKLEHEAARDDPSEEVEDTYEKPKMAPTLQSTKIISTVQKAKIPTYDAQDMPSPSDSVEKMSYLEDPHPNITIKSTEKVEDTQVEEPPIEKTVIDTKESLADYKDQLMRLEEEAAVSNQLPVEEEPVEKTVIDSEQSSTDYRDQLMRLEEEAAAASDQLPVEEEPVEKTVIDSEQSRADYRDQLMRLEDEAAVSTQLPVEEPPVEKTVIDNEQSSADYRNQLMRLEEEAAASDQLAVEEEPIEKTVMDTRESSADYWNRITRLEKEATSSIPKEPEDESVDDTLNVSQAPTKQVLISRKVFSSNESMPTELPSSGGMPKDLSQPQPYAYKELANNPQSPSDQSGSGSAGYVLYKKPDTSSEVSNSKQGKPALAGSPNDSNSSKDEKYIIEGMKAQDESINKVLDWFSRSSDSLDDQLASVGLLETSKTRPQQMGKTEDEVSNPVVDNMAYKKEATQNVNPIPKMDEVSKSEEEMKNIVDQPKVLTVAALSPMKDESLPPQQVPLTEFLAFGQSGSGGGKIQNRSINDDSQLPAEGDDDSRIGVDNLAREKEATQNMEPFPEIAEASTAKEDMKMIESDQPKNLRLSSVSSTEDESQQKELKNIDGDQPKILTVTSFSPMKVESIPLQQEPLTESLEFGQSGSGGGKIQNSSINDDSLQKYPDLPAEEVNEKYKTEDDSGTGVENLVTGKVTQDLKPIPKISETSNAKEDMKTIESDLPEILEKTSVSSIEDESVAPQQEPLTESLEFGQSGSGGGKIQNWLIDDDSGVRYPKLPPYGLYEKYKMEDEASTPDVDNFDNGKEVQQNPNASPKMNEILKSKEDMDSVESDQPKTSSPSLEDESVPPQQETLTESLEFGQSGSGAGKIQNWLIDDDSGVKYPQLPLEGTNEKCKESMKDVKEEGSVSKERMASLDEEETGETLMGKVKDQTKAPTVEQNEDQSSKNPENEKSILAQKRVSDIKRWWEGDRPSQDATKKTDLRTSKRPFSPVESITPRSHSFDSDNQDSVSLVTFKKVMVEDEEDPISPVDQLKSFWENEKNKETTKGRPDRRSVANESWSDDKAKPLVDTRSKFEKRHTIYFFDKENSTDLEKNLSGRSVSLGESANESRKKSTSFQSLKNFWNTPSQSDDKRTNQTPSATTSKQFGSNPDIRSKEPFLLPVKSRLAAKSLQDIREGPSPGSQIQVYDAKPSSREFGKGTSKKEPPQQNLANQIETERKPSNTINRYNKLEEPITSVDISSQRSAPYNYRKSSSVFSDEFAIKQVPDVSDEKQMTPTESIAPKSVAKSEISLRLRKSQDEVSDKNSSLPEERPPATVSENSPDNQNAYRDEESGEINERGRKMFLARQSEFDAGSPVLPNVPVSLQNEEKYSKNFSPTEEGDASDLNEEVNESIEKTVIPIERDPGDFDKKLQNLYNEYLNTENSQNLNLTEQEYPTINEPAQNFSKVLAVSSGNVQSSGVHKGQQPIIINISSKKSEMVREDIVKPQQQGPTETSLTMRTPSADVPTEQKVNISSTEITNVTSEKLSSEPMVSLARGPEVNELSEPNGNQVNAPQPEEIGRKEIVERIASPVILPRPRSYDFDEKLKQLFEELQSSPPKLEEASNTDNAAENNDLGETDRANVYLHSLEPKKTFLESSAVNLESSQTPSADNDGEILTKSAPLGSQAPDISVQEVNETIEKTVAPPRISTAKSLEELQKEALDEEERGFVGNVPSGHVALNESHSSDQPWTENSVSETFPGEKDAVQETTEPGRYEEPQEETRVTFMSVRQSTPVKDRDGSLRKSTLELYLEVPYRREMSKSIDFDLSGYVTSDVNKYESKLNNQREEPLAPTENSFPENAEKFKRMSQSVPTFLQDETDGRETDSASESSFQIGRHKKSPSSLTNLSGSSGMASMSSVSGSVMSVYSGDFGNVDIKGAIEFAIDYVEQLKEFHIFIYQCRDLAAAEVKKQRSDPYVKAYLLPEKAKMGKRKTAVKKKTLNPVYNEILRYKIPKQSLQTQTLNLSVWHHDALGRNSFLGEVNLNLAMWDWRNTQRNWYQLEARTPASGLGLENRGEMKLSLKYIPVSPHEVGKKPNTTGEVHIWIKECIQLPMLRENKINSFVKCTILPDTSRKSRQKTRTVDKTPNPIFNHTMVYDGFKEEDLKEACVELTVWDHNKLSNHFLGGLRLGLGTGKSYGTVVDWMDSSHEESTMWSKMIASPNTWIEGMLPLRMFKMAKLSK
ncbi:synaptotagmin-like protein 2 isoform X2 [Leptodactylus fuscus]|uniref:synaptotagmin-like protein 2 isoform X2 n=1 Tax=Leptodactylus fuscus TaxID=238119 RepID=UPI003F4EA703